MYSNEYENSHERDAVRTILVFVFYVFIQILFNGHFLFFLIIETHKSFFIFFEKYKKLVFV